MVQRNTSAGGRSVPGSAEQTGQAVHGLSFVREEHDKRGRWVSTDFFAVPDEDYGNGWRTRMVAARDLVAQMAQDDRYVDFLAIVKAASAIAELLQGWLMSVSGQPTHGDRRQDRG